jgi:hypothetical protein
MAALQEAGNRKGGRNMTVQSEELHQMCLDHFNEPVLLTDTVARVIGYAETGVDCYIIVRYPQYPDGKIVWHTCVGGYIWLRLLKEQSKVTSSGGEEWNDYTRIDSHLALNGSPPEAAFILELMHDDFEGMDKDGWLDKHLEDRLTRAGVAFEEDKVVAKTEIADG